MVYFVNVSEWICWCLCFRLLTLCNNASLVSFIVFVLFLMLTSLRVGCGWVLFVWLL